MNSIKPVIILTTLYLVIYTILSNFQTVPEQLIIGIFSFSPFIVVFMAYKILKDGEPSELTFEESFYEDKGRNRVN